MEFEPKNSKPIDYVTKKIERTDYFKFDKKKYLSPVFGYESFKESGNIEGKVGKIDIYLSYSLDDKIKNLNLRKVDKFILGNKESMIDFINMLPKDYSVYITTNIDKEDNSFESIHRSIERKIFINVPLLSIDGIMTFLHEIGHQNRDQTQNVLENFKDDNSRKRLSTSGIIEKILSGLIFRKSSIKDASRVLRDERDSWSFALQNIKPFMKDLNIDIEDLKNIIHYDALYSYSWLIRDNIDIKR